MLFVIPQATCSFLPNMTAGIPAYAIPATLNEPPRKWISCQHETAPNAMCGSLATIGLPDKVLAPETTQLLLPCPSAGSLIDTPTGCVPQRFDGYDPGGRIASASASACRKASYRGPEPRIRLASSGMTITGNRPVRYQRNSPAIASESWGRHASGR